MLGGLFDFVNRAMREVEQQFENGQDERHVETELVVDASGRLQGPGVHHDSSPKSSRAPVLETSGPVGIISHGTATTRLDSKDRPVSVALLAAIRKSTGREASWHVLVDHVGEIWQSIPFLRGAWHAGSESAASVLIDGRRVAPNACTIGIEYVNAGEARLVDAVWDLDQQKFVPSRVAWRAWPFAGQRPSDPPSKDAPRGRGPGPVVPPTELVVIGGRHWHAYTPEQFEARRRITAALVDRWPALLGELTLQHPGGRRVIVGATTCGHVDVDPKRKADPYPTFRLG